MLDSQITKDPNPVINVTSQEPQEAMSVTRSLQKTRTSMIRIEDSYEGDTDKNEASTLQNERSLNKIKDILKNSIFVLMTILSLSLLVMQGSICISK